MRAKLSDVAKRLAFLLQLFHVLLIITVILVIKLVIKYMKQ